MNIKQTLSLALLVYSATTPLNASAEKSDAPSGSEIFLADPTVYTEGGKYYMAGTRSYEPKGFTLLESSDLHNWKYAVPDSMILQQGKKTYGTTGFWAPQIFKDNDRYLLAYTANEQTAVAKADNLTDLYKQRSIRPVDNKAKNIDPFIFKDDDGKYYFYHVRFVDGNILHVAEFNPTSFLLKGEPTACFRNTEKWEDTGAYPSAPIMEGPTVIKLDDMYYMFYSANHYLSPDYAVGYATAPSPMGPWTKHRASPILHRDIVGERGSGHGDIFFDNEGNMRYVYHVHHDETRANPRRTRIITLKVDKSKGHPYTITADPESIIVPIFIDGSADNSGITTECTKASYATPVAYYSTTGCRINPSEGWKGLCIVRYSDGKTLKMTR